MIDDARTAHANTAFYRFKNTEGSRETHTRDEHTVIQGTQTTNPTTKPTYRHTISQVTTEGSVTATRLDPTPSTNTHVRRTWTGNRALSRCARLRLPLISIGQTVYGAEHTQTRTTESGNALRSALEGPHFNLHRSCGPGVTALRLYRIWLSTLTLRLSSVYDYVGSRYHPLRL